MTDVASRRDVDGRPAIIERVVTLDVNGRPYTLRLDTRVTLLDALRDRLGLVGTKKGCDQEPAARARFTWTAGECCPV